MRSEPESDQEEHSAANDEENEEEPQGPSPAKRRASSALAELLGNTYGRQEEPASAPEKSPFDIAEEEVKRYKGADPLTLSEKPLDWWKEHHCEYPLLAKLTKRYLCIPGTSVPSERVFSTAGDIITAQRSCLTSEHVDQLLFLQKNLHIPQH